MEAVIQALQVLYNDPDVANKKAAEVKAIASYLFSSAYMLCLFSITVVFE